MDKGSNELVTGSEKELLTGKRLKRLVFKLNEPINEGVMPDCPLCLNSLKVFRAGDYYVCQGYHTDLTFNYA
tara:strand:+ start:3682 stop:3897 length:216 start_codon:yes stop_codon:yes gene_type:complete